MRKKKGPNTSQWSLMKFLEEHYIPHKTESIGLTETTKKSFRVVSRSFERFAGEGVKMCEINRAKIEDFVAWSIERGLASTSAESYAEKIRVLVRAWQPARLPHGKRGGSTMVFLEQDVPGSLEELFHERYLPQHTRMNSEHSVRQCGNAIRRFTQYLGHIASLDDLTDETLGGWQRHMVHVEGMKRSSSNGYFSRVLAMWNWAAKKRLVELFPTVQKYRIAEKIPKAWTREELDMLLVACGQAKGEISEVDAADFWVAFHYVAWDTGERTGALLSLTWEMLSFQTATLSVPADVRKGGLKAMVYRLKPATLEKLKAIRQPERELIFPGAKNPHRFYAHYKKLVIAAGLTYERGKTGPQKIRRSFASYIAAKGGDPTAALRHSDTRVTIESYIDPTIACPEPPNTLLFDLESGPTKKSKEKVKKPR